MRLTLAWGVACTGKGVYARGKAPGGSLLRASSRKTARSDYEERQIVLLLQAVERMKEMVQARFVFRRRCLLEAATPWCLLSQLWANLW